MTALGWLWGLMWILFWWRAAALAYHHRNPLVGCSCAAEELVELLQIPVVAAWVQHRPARPQRPDRPDDDPYWAVSR